VCIGLARQSGNLIKTKRAGRALLTDRDDEPQLRQPVGVQIAQRRRRELGRQLAQHLEIIAAFEFSCCDERGTASLIEHIFEFADAVGGIDVDENEAGIRCGELGQHPFGVVRRPNADTVAAFQPKGDKAGGDGVNPRLQFAVGPTDPLMANDERVALTEPLDHPVEIHTDGVADEGLITRPVDIAQPGHAEPRACSVADLRSLNTPS
jgi:hypothetical protein